MSPVKRKKKATRKKAVKRTKKPATKYARVTTRRFHIAYLEPAPYNPRTVTDKALAGLGRSLQEFGLLALPVVNVAGGRARLVGGHQRVKSLVQQGEKYVHCVVVEFDEAVERKANFTLNNEAVEGQFVPELTKNLLDALQAALPEGSDLFQGLNFDALVKRVNRSFAPTAPSEAPATRNGPVLEEEEMPTLPAKSQAVSKVGERYILGRHVIHCGPPKRKGSLKGFPVERATVGILEVMFKTTPTAAYFADHLGRLLTDTDGAVFVATSTSLLPEVQRAFLRLGGHWSTTLLWLNPKAPPQEGQPYTDALIPVLYGWRKGATHVFYGGKAEGNIFNLARTPVRPHMPVEVATRALLLASDEQGWVFDPDAGHGATLIAAEKTARRLVGYVRTPRECDRLRKRWAEFTQAKGASWAPLTPRQG